MFGIRTKDVYWNGHCGCFPVHLNIDPSLFLPHLAPLKGDDDLLTVYIGEIFLEFVNMLPAFQTYCLQQSTSVNMLNTLEKEKELLRYTRRKDVKLQLASREGKVTLGAFSGSCHRCWV